jgi:hypothetical protein
MRRELFRFLIPDRIKLSWVHFSVIIITVIVFLSEWMQKIGIVSLPLGIRHISILILFLCNWILFGRPIRLNQYYTLALILIFSYLVVSLIFVPVTIFNYILGTGFTFLFVVIFILSSNTKTKLNIIIRIFKSLLLFFLLMSIGPIFKGLFAGTSLRYIPGLFRELGAFGSSMNIGVIISLSLYIITNQKKYIYYAIFLSFGVFLTLLKKSMLSNIIIWIVFVYSQVPYRMRLKMTLYGFFFIIMSLFLVSDEFKNDIKLNVDYYKRVGPEGHVRLAMYIVSFKIAYDHFPFGSGMGTFGSLASIVDGYSKVYIDYGVSKIGSNSPRDVKRGHHTLLDTYWPHILGELGFIGTSLFLFIWLFPLVSTYQILRKHQDKIINGLGFFVIMLILIMTNEGLTLYNPEIPSFVLLYSGVGGLCYFHIKNSTAFSNTKESA